MKSAAQLYTVREFTQNEKDYYETLVKVKKIGYTSVQLSAAGPMSAETVRSMSEDLDISVSATHISHNMFIQDLDQVIKNHHIMGCKYVGLGGMPKEYLETPKKLDEFIKTYSEISQTLKKEGLQFVYHNHNFEFFKFDNKTVLDILFDNTPSCFFFEIDTYWIQAGGANPEEWIRKAARRCEYIHFKDMAINAEFKMVPSPIGQGNLNWKSIVDACKYSDVLYCAVEQDTCEGSPFDALKASYNYLSSMGIR